LWRGLIVVAPSIQAGQLTVFLQKHESGHYEQVLAFADAITNLLPPRRVWGITRTRYRRGAQ